MSRAWLSEDLGWVMNQVILTPEADCARVISLSIVLVESFPLAMDYGTNMSAGVDLYEAWKHLLSLASDRVEVASFYWCLTGEDISINSSSDAPVQRDTYDACESILLMNCMIVLLRAERS